MNKKQCYANVLNDNVRVRGNYNSASYSIRLSSEICHFAFNKQFSFIISVQVVFAFPNTPTIQPLIEQ